MKNQIEKLFEIIPNSEKGLLIKDITNFIDNNRNNEIIKQISTADYSYFFSNYVSSLLCNLCKAKKPKFKRVKQKNGNYKYFKI